VAASLSRALMGGEARDRNFEEEIQLAVTVGEEAEAVVLIIFFSGIMG